MTIEQEATLYYFFSKTESGGPTRFLDRIGNYAKEIAVDEPALRLTLRSLALDGYIEKGFLEGNDEIVLTEKGRGRAREYKSRLADQTMLVKYKNVDGNYEEESKRPFIEINSIRFNPKYHERLFLRNFWRDCVASRKIDWHNPWLVGMGTAILGAIILKWLKIQ